MGNILPGELCRSWDACPYYRVVNSKHGAASYYLLGALAHGPPTSESTGLAESAGGHLNVSQSLKLKYTFCNDNL